MEDYKEVKGNIITMAEDGEFDLIVQGCNCFSTMGAGLAAQIHRYLPEAYDADLLDPRSPMRRLGDFTQVKINRPLADFVVVNLYSQYFPGKCLDVEALTIGLRKINSTYEGRHIGVPQIGCGIAGGNWEEIREIVKVELSKMKVTVVNYDI